MANRTVVNPKGTFLEEDDDSKKKIIRPIFWFVLVFILITAFFDALLGHWAVSLWKGVAMMWMSLYEFNEVGFPTEKRKK